MISLIRRWIVGRKGTLPSPVALALRARATASSFPWVVYHADGEGCRNEGNVLARCLRFCGRTTRFSTNLSPLPSDPTLLGASHRLRAFWVLCGHGDLPGGAHPLDIPIPDRVPGVKTWQECLDPGRRPPRATHVERPPAESRNTPGEPCQACWTLMKTIGTYSEVCCSLLSWL